jgi:glutamate-1-semialdehyde 2,1-aminomutase
LSRRRVDPVAGGCSTIGKLPLVLEGHAVPGRAVSARGSRFTDDRGDVWVDFDMALGSVIWGHGREDFADAIKEAFLECDAASVPTVRERDAAWSLLNRLDRYEQVRFFKTGADACSAAVRLARAATRRPIVAADGYHGWHDWSVAWAYPDDARTLGILPAVKDAVQPLNPGDDGAVARRALFDVGDRLAAIVLRPEAWRPDALAEIAEHCRAAGAVLVFDEVTSHFKYGRAGTAGAIGIFPDLLCISKGLANGLPLAAVLGKERLMRHATSSRISTTYATESIALAAAMLGERLLDAADEWPTWRDTLFDVVQSIRMRVEEIGLSNEVELIVHPGFFSIERRGTPFKSDPLRSHIVGHLGARRLFSRGWFHGSDRHTAEDWFALRTALDDALVAWAAGDGRTS